MKRLARHFQRAAITGLTLVGLALIGTPAFGQLVNVTSVSPQAAKPGDFITLRGTGFLNSTHARFTANVGGVVGLATQIVALNATSDTFVTTQIPTFGAFTFPPDPTPGSPNGFFDVRDAGGLFSAPVNVYYLEGDHAGVTTNGLGSTNSSTFRGAASFTISGGPPTPGNGAFVFTGENLTPTSLSHVVLGFPPSMGPIPILDGILAFDPFLPFGVPGSFASDAMGRALVPAPLAPGMFGITFTLSWVYIDSVTFVAHISNGLQFTI